jgi:hypothetical protein
MSRIWDLLKDVERLQTERANTARAKYDGEAGEPSLPFDRRRSERTGACLAIFVYGHSTDREPFYEASELLSVNAMGGLITLERPLAPGQRLLLTSQKNQRDQECRVIGLRSGHLKKFAIGVAFERPLPEFWSGAE